MLYRPPVLYRMVKRPYSIEFEGVTVSAAQDLFEIQVADDRHVAVTGFSLSVTGTGGDANEEFLRLQIIRGHQTPGSGGSAVTPVRMNPNDSAYDAAGSAAAVNNTTIASGATDETLFSHTLNTSLGLSVFFPPGMELLCDQLEAIVNLRLMAAPSGSLTMNGTLYFMEF